MIAYGQLAKFCIKHNECILLEVYSLVNIIYYFPDVIVERIELGKAWVHLNHPVNPQHSSQTEQCDKK